MQETGIPFSVLIQDMSDAEIRERVDAMYPAQKIGPTWQVVDDRWLVPEYTLGFGVIEWISENLLSPDGSGEPFSLTFEQMRFIMWLYAIDRNGKFLYANSVLQRCKGWGKDPVGAALCMVELLGPVVFSHWENGEPIGKQNRIAQVRVAAVALEQPIDVRQKVATPGGWKTVGELTIGDEVFGSDGLIERVQRETEVFTDKECLEVVFDDGQSIVTSAGHGWTFNSHNGHGDGYIDYTMTTAEMAKRVARGRDLPAIPCALRHSCDIDLPIDPYLLGYWLGDGRSRFSAFAVGDEDLPAFIENLEGAILPYEKYVGTRHVNHRGVCNEVAVSNKVKPSRASPEQSMFQRLRGMGLIKNKHIPDQYMFAGTSQRLALLQGLMDSDGHVSKTGHCIFTNSNPALIKGFRELAASLGYKPRVHDFAAGHQQVSFWETRGARVARLARKQDKVRVSRDRRASYRYVTEVRPTPTVPVKCIGIDTDDHLFQVGDGILTHNTENTRDLFPTIIPERTVHKYNLDVQKEIIYVKGTGCKLRVISSSARSAEGGRITFFLANEIHHWDPGNGGIKFYQTMMNNLRKVGGRFVAITNGYEPGEESVLELIRESQQRIWDGLAAPNGWLYDSLEAHPKAPLELDIASRILETLMGDSSWLKRQIPEIVQSFTDSSIPASRQRRMWYNQIVSSEEQAFAIDEVEAVIDRTTTGTLEDLSSRDRITLGFDGSRTDDATALVAYRLSDKLVVPLAIWEKPDTVSDWHVPTEDVDSMVGLAFANYEVVGFYADVKDWESYIARWSELFRENLLVRASSSNSIGYDMRGHRSEIAFLNETLIGMVRDQEIRLSANGRLRTHFLNAERRWTGGHLSFGKIGGRESPRKIDALIATSLAVKAAMDYTEHGKTEKPKYKRQLHQW